jgi:signal transduction histidine kinase
MQALRLLQADALVALPFNSDQHCSAVMLLGLDADTQRELHARRGLLDAFTRQVSEALLTLKGGDDTLGRRVAEVTEEFQARAQRAAHEVNNPLAIIQNYFTVLERKLVKHELGGSEIPLLREEVERIVNIVHGLCEFQPTAADNKLTDLRSVIGNIVQLFEQTEFLPSAVRLSSSVPDGTVEIDSDIDALKQILINLVKNAVEALPQGGDIRVDIHERLANRDGKLFAVLSVKDSGPGIPDDVMARLFTPVKSSKGSGYRGLGLNIVNNLVKSIGGYITCHSDAHGTNFEILLPVSALASKMIPPKYATRTAASL